jgi:hypothetical protein
MGGIFRSYKVQIDLPLLCLSGGGAGPSKGAPTPRPFRLRWGCCARASWGYTCTPRVVLSQVEAECLLTRQLVALFVSNAHGVSWSGVEVLGSL